MAINILSKHVAELIAAGEVVERPSSVVKELVENSIDAGSRNIYVEIENGGIRKIVVQDDGSGIEYEDIRKAFIRHATSKIKDEEDLGRIHSLGFRGEALASIASVSNLTLTTKPEDREFGVEYVISGGEEVSFETQPSVDGTRFVVRDLFFNTPARMKFLKRDTTEAGYVQDIITNLALSRPDISFTFVRDSRQVFSTTGDGRLINTIRAVFGTEFASDLIPVDYEEGGFRIEGYTTIPFKSRNSRNMQFSFINDRFVKNKTVIAAAENGYKDTTMVGKFPGYVLKIYMPYEAVDVNVHPSKTEVRFARDGDVYGAVYRAVKLAVDGDTHLKKFDFKDVLAENKPESTVKQITITDTKTPENSGIFPTLDKNGEGVDKFISKFYVPDESAFSTGIYSGSGQSSYNRSNASRVIYDSSGSQKNDRITDEEIYSLKDLRLDLNRQSVDIDKEDEGERTTDRNFRSVDAQDIRILGEVFETYVLCTVEDEFVIIDKHAAHERMLYEKLKANAKNEKQMLLAPATVRLSAEEKDAVLENISLLDDCGFEIEDFGEGGVILRAIPMYITGSDPAELLTEIAYNLSQGSKADLSEKIEWIFHSVACRSAIKAGDKNDINRLTALVRDIKNRKVPLYCPHGRPVLVTISRKDLEKQFGR